MRCDYSFDKPIWRSISQPAQLLVSSLLQMNPTRRPTAVSVLHSYWLRTASVQAERTALNATEMNKMCSSLAQYADEAKLKRVALMLIAHRSSTEEIVKLRDIFEAYDTSGDGVISFDEFRKALMESKMQLSRSAIRTLFDKLVSNNKI